jgi:hypothetical protein
MQQSDRRLPGTPAEAGGRRSYEGTALAARGVVAMGCAWLCPGRAIRYRAWLGVILLALTAAVGCGLGRRSGAPGGKGAATAPAPQPRWVEGRLVRSYELPALTDPATLDATERSAVVIGLDRPAGETWSMYLCTPEGRVFVPIRAVPGMQLGCVLSPDSSQVLVSWATPPGEHHVWRTRWLRLAGGHGTVIGDYENESTGAFTLARPWSSDGTRWLAWRKGRYVIHSRTGTVSVRVPNPRRPADEPCLAYLGPDDRTPHVLVADGSVYDILSTGPRLHMKMPYTCAGIRAAEGAVFPSYAYGVVFALSGDALVSVDMRSRRGERTALPRALAAVTRKTKLRPLSAETVAVAVPVAGNAKRAAVYALSRGLDSRLLLEVPAPISDCGLSGRGDTLWVSYLDWARHTTQVMTVRLPGKGGA